MSTCPSKAELDERVTVDLDPQTFVEKILETGPHPDELVKDKPDKADSSSVSKGSNFSPRTWIRYWYFGMVFGVVCFAYGVVDGSARLAFLGVAIVVLGFPMIAFWKQKERDANESPS